MERESEGQRGAVKGTALSAVKPSPVSPQPMISRGKREQRKVQTRMEILQAAMSVFGEMGYGETRVEDILDAAGISRPTFYRFFAGKDELYDAVDELASMSLMQMISSALTSVATPEERLEKSAEAYLRWLAVTGPIATVLRQDSSRATSPLYARRRHTLATLSSMFDDEVYRAHGVRYDDLLFSSLMGAIETIGNELTAGGKRVGEKDIQRGQRVVRRILRATLCVDGKDLPEIPVK